ncbi:MAG: hypothetical protein PHC31_09660 [Clostridia bacterium]|nr:hypothetical protein [Clostridia bacterium]
MQSNISLESIKQWSCPQCGFIPEEKMVLYNKSFKFQNFTTYPILPTCLTCGSEIIFHSRQAYNTDKRIIVLTGTCGSGKTSTGEMLMSKYGFYLIDGDCVTYLIKNKLGIKKIELNGVEELQEISNEIDILLSLNKDIVLSQVIPPNDIQKYQKLFESKNLKYKIFVLHPSCSTSILRTQTRTCFNGVIDEKYVKYFYDELDILRQHKNDNIIIFDNSNYSVEESADKIIQMFYNK